MTGQERKKIQKLKIVFVGRPGSGKGTQVDLLRKNFNLILIPSPGDIYRDPKFRKTEIGQKICPIVDKGEFAPDEITNRLMEKRIFELTKDNIKGFISEGYPRTLGQAEFADKKIGIDLLINLEVSEKKIVQRLSNRRVCPRCKVNYSLTEQPPRQENICDLCQSPLTQREDDRPGAVRNRMEVYHRTAETAIEYYRKQNKVVDINGDQPVEKVFEDIITALRVKIKNPKF